MIHEGHAGRDINIVQRIGIGAIGIAGIVVAVIAAMSSMRDPEIRIDPAVVLSVAEAQGYVSSEAAALLTDRVKRAQTDLEGLQKDHPVWKTEIDAAIKAFNKGNLKDAGEAFARVDALMAASRAELSKEEARSKYMQATLFHPFEYSKAEPLLCAAAELDGNDIWYWIECGRARIQKGSLEQALAAFEKANSLAEYVKDSNERAAALNEIGDVRMAQGQLAAALVVYDESLGIRRKLAAQDPGNAGWARDVCVSLWMMAEAEQAMAAERWAEVIQCFEAIQSKGVLFPADEQFLQQGRQNLARAQQ